VETPTFNSADRRRSGRAASAKKNYIDRDDNEDDEEMMDGVAEWEYIEEGDDREPPSPNHSSSQQDELEQESRVDIAEAAQAAESEDEETPVPEPVQVEEEVRLTPPRSNGKKARARPVKKAMPVKPSLSPAKIMKLKPKSPLTKTRAKKPITIANPPAKVAPKSKAKGKGKAKVKDIFDMDESD
jgi:sister-chromatid-cohesion protein PDS5